MKKLPMTVIAVTFIAGCSIFPANYDNNEYELLARLETSIQHIQRNCSDPELVERDLPRLTYDAELLHTYSYYIPQNSDVYDMVKILKNDVFELEAQYNKGKGNTLYCKLKTKAFLAKVRTTLEVVATKQR